MRDTPHEHNLVEHNEMKDFLKSHLKFHTKVLEGLGIIRCRGPHSRVLGKCVARLRLNDGAKLWISFKHCFKTNDFLSRTLEKYMWDLGWYV
jgi:hypothetical protein